MTGAANMVSDQRILRQSTVCLVVVWCAIGAAPGDGAERQGSAGEPQQVESTVQLAPYVYESGGRRDPFVSVLGQDRAVEGGARIERPPGLAGFAINELTLRGLVRSRGEYLAVMETPTETTYILRGDERLYDGTVLNVSDAGVVFLQDVSDSSALATGREVLRSLPGSEEPSP